MTREQLLAELLLERYGAPPLPPPAPPHPVEKALADRAVPLTRSTVRRQHLVVLDGGQSTTAA
ncbi:hypothetical protein ACGF7U_31310 [Micromonospora sp. NPDC047670]|uniref:hypothetical protein n=1 Tax=Micromonospora sp. NPDC047670 TaxID=3364252 RepID=UPI0037174116